MTSAPWRGAIQSVAQERVARSKVIVDLSPLSEESPTPYAEQTTSLSVQPKWKPTVPKKGKKSKKMAKVGR